MGKRLFFVFTLLLFLGTGLGSAQNVNIKGKVVDAESEPVIGASVVVKGSTIGTVTDVNGAFSFAVPKNSILEVSYVGMLSERVRVDGHTVFNITLKEDSKTLDEVVVVGYGTVTKRNVTASVATVKGDNFRDIPNPNAESALQGRASGVSIITPNAGVGQAPVVRIRGVSSITSGTEPLYVVDGVPVESGNVSNLNNINALSDINPADIVSMDVLKDAAAAALYGSRAANGVVLITTRKGQQDNTKISYSGWVGISSPSKTLPVMNAQEYVDFKNMAVKNRYGKDEMSLTSGYVSPYGNKAFNMYTLSDGSTVDTDWSKYIYQTGFQHYHNVSMSGGSKKIQYFLSFNYTNQTGVVMKDHYDRLGGNASVTANATDWLKFDFKMNATQSKTEYADKGRKGSLYATHNFSRMALILPPNVPAYNEDGTPYNGDNGGIGYASNTVYNGYATATGIYDNGSIKNSDIARIISSYSATVTPIKGLSLKSLLGIDYMTISDFQFDNPYTGDGFEGDATTNGASYQSRVKNYAVTFSNTAQYDWNFGNHQFSVLAGFETYSKKRERWGAERTGLLDSAFSVYQADYYNTYPYSNYLAETTMMSYLGRLNYDYKSKYILSLNFRRDGFSALSKNNRWGNFGGVSAAWRISEEPFFEPLKNVFSDFKIKGSWGVVGNTNVDAYAAKSYYSSGFYGNSGAYYLSSIADSENLKWESSTKSDIGFSALLPGNVSIDFDYYYNKASDLILNVPTAVSKGIPSNKITTNAGKMSNSGIEFSVSADVIHSKSFKWNTQFNIATQRNRVLALASGIDYLLGGEEMNMTVVGKSIGQLYLYKTKGIDPETGRRIYVANVNGQEVDVLCKYEKSGKFFRKDDGTLVSQSNLVQDICGNTMPTYYGGWTNDLTYKNWGLSVLMQYSGGNKIYNGTTATTSDMRYWNNTKDVLHKYWKQAGDVAKYAYPIYGDNYSNGSALPISDWVENGDYLRCKQVTLSYNFDTSKWSKKIGVSSLRVYASATNLFCITGYSGLDPESLISDNGQAALQGGIDKNCLPQARTYTFGVNIGF